MQPLCPPPHPSTAQVSLGYVPPLASVTHLVLCCTDALKSLPPAPPPPPVPSLPPSTTVLPPFPLPRLKPHSRQLLRVAVMNERLGADAVLGTVLVPVFPFVCMGGHLFQAWLPLRSRDGAGTLGQVHLALQFLPMGVASVVQMAEAASVRQLSCVVRVRQARDLTDVETFGKLDP